jgi:2-polyprenyl-6-methoxyphenol hydroxylase-like FAD-dependent oxidoreductase
VHRVLPTRFPFYYKISQNDFEQALRELLFSKYSIGPEYRTEIVSLEQKGEEVTATIRRPDGSTETNIYPWVVGCDGVHSFVRNAAGIKFDGGKVAVMSMSCSI